MAVNTITFDDGNRVDDTVHGGTAEAVSQTLFGAIALDVNTTDTVRDQGYEAHFKEVFGASGLGLHFLRYPDGELPDGFMWDNGDRKVFTHNKINGGNQDLAETDYVEKVLGGDINNIYDEDFVTSLTPAFSLSYHDLLHEDMLSDPDNDRIGFRESLKIARDAGVPYSLVLPEFQYLRLPHDRDPDGDGVKSAFNLADHVIWDSTLDQPKVTTDLKAFLERLFDGHYGALPDAGIIIELGNESYFGWNQHYFTPDPGKDRDSFSGFTYGALKAVAEFRAENPDADFKVSMQAHGPLSVEEIAANYRDIEGLGPDQVSTLFKQVDVIDTAHVGLDATLEGVRGIEEDWAILNGIDRKLGLIDQGDGDPDAVEIYNSAWSGSGEEILIPGGNGAHYGMHDLPAATAVLSYFSGLVEMGADYAANWGVGSFNGNATDYDPVTGEVTYAAYALLHGRLAADLPGTHHLHSDTMDDGRDTNVLTFAFENDSQGILYLAANDYTGDHTVNLDFGTFATLGAVTVERLTKVDGRAQFEAASATVAGNAITVSFGDPGNEAYEILRVVVDRGIHHGTADADIITTDSAFDHISAKGGDDVVNSGAGDDTVYGGTGNDTINGGDGTILSEDTPATTRSPAAPATT